MPYYLDDILQLFQLLGIDDILHQQHQLPLHFEVLQQHDKRHHDQRSDVDYLDYLHDPCQHRFSMPSQQEGLSAPRKDILQGGHRNDCSSDDCVPCHQHVQLFRLLESDYLLLQQHHECYHN